MKIVVNLTTLTQKGIVSIWLKKFQELSKLNSQLDLFYGQKLFKFNDQTSDIYQNNQTNSIKSLPNPNTKFQFTFHCLYQNFQALFKIKQFKKYDVFYSPSSVFDLTIIPFFTKIRYPQIIWTTVFDNIVPISDPGNKITRFFAWLFFQFSLILIRRADIIFTISPELQQFLIKKNFNKNKIVITGNGVEMDLIKQSSGKKYLFDALFIGRINETKGIFDMLNVLKQVKKTYPKFTLAIMGDGDEITKNKFKKQIHLMDLMENIKFLGYISGIEKFNIIKSSRCFWFLSISPSESFGIALMEAVSCGIPAFTYDLPVFKKIYNNQEVIFSPIYQTDIVAQKVINLFQSKKFFNLNGHKLLGKYSWENIVKIELSSIKTLPNSNDPKI